MVDSTNPRVMADNIKMLAAAGGGVEVVANPEGVAMDELEKLGVGEEIYSIPKISDFSTSEVNTGIKWIDNKEIYVKVVTGTTPATATSGTIAHGITNISDLLWYTGTAKRSDGVYASIDHARSEDLIWSLVGDTNITVNIKDTDWASQPVIFILAYTKATES